MLQFDDDDDETVQFRRSRGCLSKYSISNYFLFFILTFQLLQFMIGVLLFIMINREVNNVNESIKVFIDNVNTITLSFKSIEQRTSDLYQLINSELQLVNTDIIFFKNISELLMLTLVSSSNYINSIQTYFELLVNESIPLISKTSYCINSICPH